jgi:Family of unknown function (DUF6529)
LEGLVETLTRGNVAEVKVLLASIALVLGAYQLLLIAVGYGKIRPGFLNPGPASSAHRAIGDAIATLLLLTGVMCLSYYGFDDEKLGHTIAGSALLSILALKVIVVRRDLGLGGLLPVLGLTVFTLIAVTWGTSAGGFLADA